MGLLKTSRKPLFQASSRGPSSEEEAFKPLETQAEKNHMFLGSVREGTRRMPSKRPVMNCRHVSCEAKDEL